VAFPPATALPWYLIPQNTETSRWRRPPTHRFWWFRIERRSWRV
jgi:hypothetical protein